MGPATLLVLILMNLPGLGAEPSELVRQLGSGSFDRRVEAVEALERLGLEALPALREAWDDEDPRIRRRARDLEKAIEDRLGHARLIRPTLVRLDFHDRPLSEVIDTLNARHDFGLVLELDPDGGMRILDPARDAWKKSVRARRISLEAPGPVPFWEAIDRLCRAGDLRYDLHPSVPFGPDLFSPRRQRFRLYADRGGSEFHSDDGPFRVKVLGLHAVSEVDFTDGEHEKDGEPPLDRELAVQLALIAGPGVAARPSGGWVVTEATDDRGRSLRIPGEKPSGAGPVPPIRIGPRNEMTSFSSVVHLRFPERPGRKVARLKGTVSVEAEARRPGPLVIPLSPEIQGRPVQNNELTAVVHEIQASPDSGMWIDVGVTDRRAVVPDPSGGHAKGVSVETPRSALDRVELYDAQGRKLNWTWDRDRGRHGFEPWLSRITMQVDPIRDDSPAKPGEVVEQQWPVPSELRVYSFVQEVIEVEFEFRDIPMP